MIQSFSLMLAAFFLFFGCTNTNSFKGYKTLKTETVKTINSDVVELVHEKSGATVVLIKNQDPARSFMVGFRTPPYDDTGLFHIFEHAVLEGSRLYPSKSNFFHLANSSVASFINAMTGSVYTLYPYVTRSVKDYDNLLSVYMDAVFFPKVLEDPRIIQREGWRYEVDPDKKSMKINGIVLSEMKGAFSSPYRSLYFQLGRALVPDTPYAFESGGLPEKIATLTFDQIVSAHKKFYHPQNSVIYLYGDLDYKKQLKTIDKQFLSHFTKTKDYKRPAINLQTDFNYDSPIVTGTYPGPKAKGHDFISKGYVFGSKLTSAQVSASQVLLQAFVENNAAPLKLAIVKQGLAKSSSTMGLGGEDNATAIVFEGAQATDKAKIEKVLNEEIQKVVESGIDSDLLNSILNKYEFSYKEKNSNGSHKGMQLGSIVLQNWIYQDEPLKDALDFVAHFKEVRKILKDSEYIKSFFKNYLQENKKARWMVLQPDPDFSKKFNAGLEAQVKKALLSKKIEDYTSDFTTYETWVAEKEPQEILDKTPTLKLSDIKSDEKPISFTKSEIGKTEVLLYPQSTSGISYLTLFFDLEGVSQEYLKNLELFTSFIKRTDTSKTPFKDLSKRIDTSIGGIGFDVSVPQSVKNPEALKPDLVVGLRFLNENTEKALELVTELLTEAQFGSSERLSHLIDELKTNMKSSASYRAPGLASSASSRSFYPQINGFNALVGGPDFEIYMAKQNISGKQLQTDLQKMRSQIFNQNRLSLVTITADQNDIPSLVKKVENLKGTLSDAPSVDQTWNFNKLTAYDGFVIPGEVQYVYEAANFKNEDMDFNGAMLVYSRYLNNNYMTPKLREQAGAYGGGSSFSRNGTFKLSTYKDPNLKRSLDIFSEALDFMENENLSADTLRPAILGSLKSYYSDNSLSAKTAFMTRLYRTEQSWDDYMKIKKQILETTPEDIKKINQGLRPALKNSKKAVSGNRQKLNNEAKFLKNVLTL